MNARPAKTGFVINPVSLQHNNPGHPEHAGRMRVIQQELDRSGLKEKLIHLPARAATGDELLLGHENALIERVRFACESAAPLGGDTYTTTASFEASTTAAGSLIDLTRSVICGEAQNGFAVVRPPGHHATRSQAMGFCLFNNIAIAAKFALQQPGIDKVAIVDFDVHHGNGTQDIAGEDPDILFISTHSYPFYPGTGAVSENRFNSILDCPLPSGSGDLELQRIYSELIPPLLRRFEPDLILVSAGYDGHWQDPLGNFSLTLNGYADMASQLLSLAEETCRGRIVFTLEGGYNLDVLGKAVTNSLALLLGQEPMHLQDDGTGGSQLAHDKLERLLKEIAKIHQL